MLLVGRSLVSWRSTYRLAGSGTTDSNVVVVSTTVAVVSGTGVVTVVPTGFISAWVGLVHPANSAQKKSVIHMAAIVAYFMNNPFVF
jgi:hypothetical protein